VLWKGSYIASASEGVGMGGCGRGGSVRSRIGRFRFEASMVGCRVLVGELEDEV
jgi:hypothetical protein